MLPYLVQEHLQSILGVKLVQNLGRYLGVPSSFTAKKTLELSHVAGKVWSTVQGWKSHFFSTGGKEILIKSVAQATPTYTMSCFQLPNRTITDISRAISRFWWGSSNTSRKMHWCKWEKVCCPRSRGGLGFKDIRLFNQALLAKQAWRILHHPNLLANRIIKAKYFPNTTFLEAEKGRTPSFFWKSVLWGRDLLQQGLRYKVGNGESIQAFRDKWTPRERLFTPLPLSTPPNSLSVADLITPSRTWNLHLLQRFFHPDDIPHICSIPLNQTPTPDSWMWHYSKDGAYSVKSGYDLALTLKNSASPSSFSTTWKDLWTLQLP